MTSQFLYQDGEGYASVRGHTFNRMNVIVRQPAGDYQPGQWD